MKKHKMTMKGMIEPNVKKHKEAIKGGSEEKRNKLDREIFKRKCKGNF